MITGCLTNRLAKEDVVTVQAMRVRWLGKIAVVGVGQHATGEPVPPGSTLVDVCAGSRGVVVDLAGCRLVSSEIINFLILAERAAKAYGNKLRVCSPHAEGRRVLSEFKLDRFIPFYPTMAETLASFDPPAE